MERKKPLETDAEVKGLQPEAKSYYVMSEIKAYKGFGVRVFPSGSKSFVFRYKLDGQQKLLKLGEYPAVSLKLARELHQKESMKVRDLRRGSKDGADPVQEIKKQKELRITAEHERRKAISVSDLVNDYIVRHASVKKRNWTEDKRILNKELVSRFGKLKADKLSRADIIRMIDEIAETSPSSAAQTLKIVRKMFNWAIEKAILENTPCTGVKADPDNERVRYLSESEVSFFWSKLDEMPITDSIRRALKLVLFTGQRPGEVIGIHTNETAQEWSGKWFWNIPGSRTKNKRHHRVYLTQSALDLIGPLQATDSETGEMKPIGYIFPCPHKDKNKAIAEHAMATAVRRCFKWPMKDKKGKPLFGADGKPATENIFDMEPWRPHDLRRTANTFMTREKVPLEHRERVLNHTLGKLDRIYNQHDFDDEKQVALETLERKILNIINGSDSKIIPITAGKKAV